MGKLLFEEESRAIIGAAMEVHSEMGSGFLEAVYESAMAVELNARGIRFERQRHLPVVYKGVEVGHYITDIVVEHKIIIELKAVASGLTKEHIAQTLNYLKATGYPVGLLFNFGKPSLEYKRFVRTNQSA